MTEGCEGSMVEEHLPNLHEKYNACIENVT